MKESTKNQSILQIDHQRGHHVQIDIALLVKMQNEFTSHLKRQRCENGKENIVEQGVNFNFNYPRTNKTVKILDMSLRLKVCPVYKTYPITEIKNALDNSLAPVLIQRCETVVILLAVVIS